MHEIIHKSQNLYLHNAHALRSLCNSCYQARVQRHVTGSSNLPKYSARVVPGKIYDGVPGDVA